MAASPQVKKGARLRRGLCRRVVFASAQGATAPAALRVADYRSAAMLIKSALRDLLFCVMWHDKHSADWLAALASPYPAAPDFPLFRGKNKTPRSTLFINGSTVSTGYSATTNHEVGERWWRQPPKGECISSPAGRLYGFPTGESPVVKVLYKTGAFYNLKAPTSPTQRYYITPEGESPQPACKAKPITGRTLTAQGRKARRLPQPSRP